MTRIKDARVHCVVLNIRSAPHSPPSVDSASCGPTKDPYGPTPNPPHGRSGSLVPQDPTTCTSQQLHPRPVPTLQAERTEVGSITPNCTVNVPPMSYPSDTFGPNQAPGHRKRCQMLLRKEVIQPHLPVRLPCYDLVLITDPTFDGSFHKG
jgi:hypothetical protein